MWIKTRPLCSAAILFALTTTVHAGLTLVCQHNGRQLTVARVEAHQLICQDGEKLVGVAPESTEATWSLVGTIRENADVVQWAPTYWISANNGPDRERATQSHPYKGGVSVWHQLSAPTDYFVDFARQWPNLEKDYKVAVLAWLVEGKVVHCAVRILPPAEDAFTAAKQFDLTRDEAAGQGIALLWLNGRFVPPTARFSTPTAQAAFVAASLDDAVAIQAALKAGVSATASDRFRTPLLQYAAAAGAAKVVDILLAAGARTWTHSIEGTPLTCAAQNGRAAVVRRFMQVGAMNYNDGIFPALFRALDYDHEDAALEIIRAMPDAKFADKFGHVALRQAIDSGLAGVAAAMLPKLPPTTFDDEQNAGVVLTQARLGHTAVVHLLLAHGAKADFAFHDVTPLIAGAVSNDPALARDLLAHGAAVKQVGEAGLSPLMAAAASGSAAYAQVLLEAGAPVDAAMKTGMTALLVAARHNAADMMKLLLAHGADPHLQAHGLNALEVALDADAQDSAGLLSAVGARLNVREAGFPDRMARAIAYDLAPVVERACADGWSPDSLLYQGWAPRELAEFYHATAAARVLQEHGAIAHGTGPAFTGASQLDQRLQPRHIVPATDPRDSERTYPRGEVMVEAIIGSDGLVYGARTIKASDNELRAPAIAAVQQWRFAPPMSHARPVAVKLQLPLVFAGSEEAAYESWEVDKGVELIKDHPIEIPDPLRKLGGLVMVEFIVNAAGTTEHIQVPWTSHPEYREYLVQAASTWKYKPAQFDGKPVPERVRITFEVD